MLQQRFNYKPNQNTSRRRKKIKQAIQTTDFDTVYLSLEQLQNTVKGYKIDRVQNDLNWLRQNKKKYYSKLFSETSRNKKTA